jgi:predicted transglutaminase-like cysteine proteinase
MREWNTVRPMVESADFHQCVSAKDCEGREIVRRALKDVTSADLARKLDVINRTVNGLVRYLPDALDKGSLDAWASPDETLSRGTGDCEDYAILKMAVLNEAGVPMKNMSVVVVRDTRRNLYHAVLAVSTDEGYRILDNLRDKVSSDGDFDNYMPLYSVGGAGGWVHGSMPPRESAGAS